MTSAGLLLVALACWAAACEPAVGVPDYQCNGCDFPPGEPPDADTPDPDVAPRTDPVPVDPRTDPVPVDPAAPTGGTDRVVLSAGGRYLLSLTATPAGRCLAVADVETYAVTVYDDLCQLRAIAPGAEGRGLLLSADGQQVVLLGLADGQHSTIHTSDQPFLSMVAAPDGTQVALANLPADGDAAAPWEVDPFDLALRQLVLVDVPSGESQSFLTANATRDVDFSADQVVVTMSFWDKFGLPNATLQVFDRATKSFGWDVTFPNCADDLKLQPGGGPLAILAPRTCLLHDVIIAEPDPPVEWTPWEDDWQGDPISLVDLDAKEHLANVPGFGPVSWAPDGKSAAGFTERQVLMEQWNYFVSAPFGVIVVDTADFTWRITDVGDVRPNYVYSPDGGAIFVDGQQDGHDFTGRIDVATGELSVLGGSVVRLERPVAAADGSAIFVTDAGQLHRLAPDAAHVTTAPLAVTGDRLHARPQGDLLLWTDRAAGRHHLIGAGGLTLTGTIDLPGTILSL